MTKSEFDLDSYHEMSTSACFVCRIVEGDPLIPGVHILAEDEFMISFLNQFPTQEGYALVCPKRHVERFESDLSVAEWTRLQEQVHRISVAVARTTDAMRMYVASWGSPQRNSHLHVHVCPCPQGTPVEEQQLAAMDMPDGTYLNVETGRMAQLAESIRRNLPDISAGQ